MKKIIVPNPTKDNLTDQFIALTQTLAEIGKETDVIFDFSEQKKIYPLTILPLYTYMHDRNNKINPPSIAGAKIPITCFSNTPDIKTRDNLIYDFGEKLYITMGGIEGTKDAIFYPIIELITNIFEHSHKDEGWAFGQLDPGKKHLDICIIDTGRGLRESYLQEKKLKLTDEEAIGQAIIGNSTKPENERGFGIKTSIKVVYKGLKGSFIMMSGKAALLKDNNSEEFITLDKAIWGGVVLAYRIPLPTGPIDMYQYVE